MTLHTYLPNTKISSSDHNDDHEGLANGTNDTDNNSLGLTRYETMFDHVASGCVVTGDSYGASLAASMTAGVVYIGETRVVVAAVTAHAYTASKDTYVDVDDDGTITYTEVSNNAASPALAASNIRLAIVITDGTDIQDAGSINQGGVTKVLPIASSIPYTVTDSLGNLICPRDPNRRILGYRQRTSSFSGSATSVAQVTGLTMPIKVPTNRKIKLSLFYRDSLSTGGGSFAHHEIWDGTVGSGTRITAAQTYTGSATNSEHVYAVGIITTSGDKTYNAGYYVSANGITIECSATEPAFIMAELM
jgi:hypothetical protein